MENLFNPDGTLTNLYFSRAAANRGMMLAISIGKSNKSLSLVDRDFPTIYKTAVNMLIDYAQVQDDDVKAKMYRSMYLFLLKYDLDLEPVCQLRVRQSAFYR